MLVIELMLLLTTFFPLYHLFTALRKEKEKYTSLNMENSFSILVPCYNESICISKTIDALLKLEYKNYEVIFINDGSSDTTMQILKEKLQLNEMYKRHANKYYYSKLYNNFICIDKPNSGKALALNEGIKTSSNDIIITLDADSILSPDCLHRMNNVFMDSDVAAAGGAIHIVQANNTDYLKQQSIIKKLLIKIQSIDYLKGFFIYKLSLSRQNALAIISGAFGAFRKTILNEVGGFRKSLGEDIDITIKIQKYIIKNKQKIAYLPGAACYTECPESISDLYRQRMRWQKGFIDCVIYHSKFLLSTCLSTPVSFFMIFEALCIGIFSSILPTLTVFVLVLSGSVYHAVFIFSICFIVNIIYSSLAYVISGKYSYPYKRKYPLSIILDILFMKPFLSIVYLFGTIGYLVNKSDWNKTKRSTQLAENQGLL